MYDIYSFRSSEIVSYCTCVKLFLEFGIWKFVSCSKQRYGKYPRVGRKKEVILHMHCVIGSLYVICRLTLYKSSNYGNIYRNKQPRKTIQYYFAIYPRINGRVPKDAWRSILAPLFLGFRCGSSSSDTERTARREY